MTGCRYLSTGYRAFAAILVFFLCLSVFSPPSVAGGSGITAGKLLHMKLVDKTITDADLDHIKALGFTVLNSEWGMDAVPPAQLLALLDRFHQRGLRFIVNLSDSAAWGYRPDGNYTADQPPVWQAAKVKSYIERIRHHPAIYAYDISNEAGENLPNGLHIRISLEQMREAAADVRFADRKRPVLIRMRYWDEMDGDFTDKSPFGTDVADIVMLNLYSNYSTDGTRVLLPNMVKDSGKKLVEKILAVDGSVKIWISLAAFRDMPHFIKPAVADIKRDIRAAVAIEGVESIGFFGWGSPENREGWYLPREGAELLEFLRVR